MIEHVYSLTRKKPLLILANDNKSLLEIVMYIYTYLYVIYLSIKNKSSKRQSQFIRYKYR